MARPQALLLLAMVERRLLIYVSMIKKYFLCTLRYQALDTTLALLPCIIDTLELIRVESGWDAASSSTATSLLRSVTTFSFIATLTISHLILSVTHGLCLKLQG